MATFTPLGPLMMYVMGKEAANQENVTMKKRNL